MNLQQALQKSLAGGTLSRPEAQEVFASALAGPADPAQLAAFLCSLATRGESADEIAGAAEALRAAMLPFEHSFPDAIDTCGTGGDGLGTFNLSTAAALVAAAAGAHVIKHGNRAASSRCGSADLLEAAGLPLALSPGASRAVLDEVGITFLFAPAYHPALRHAAPVRKALGVRTLFNLLGPLVNPGRPRRQLVGLGDPRRLAVVAAVLASLGVERGLVVHGAGGADELTLAGPNQVLAVGLRSTLAAGFVTPDLAPAPLSALAGGDAAENLRLLAGVLAAERGPLRDTVELNASAALVVAGVAADAAEGLERARAALESGAVRDKLSRWIATARRVEVAA